MLFFERIDCEVLDLSHLTAEPDTSILCQDISIARSVPLCPGVCSGRGSLVSGRNRDPARIRHTPLDASELPKPGTLVAIDAEFVALSMVSLRLVQQR